MAILSIVPNYGVEFVICELSNELADVTDSTLCVVRLVLPPLFTPNSIMDGSVVFYIVEPSPEDLSVSLMGLLN